MPQWLQLTISEASAVKKDGSLSLPPSMSEDVQVPIQLGIPLSSVYVRNSRAYLGQGDGRAG